MFDALHHQNVALEAVVLKPNMILPGFECSKQETVQEVAEATVECLKRSVAAAVAGIAFLSGGQSARLASARLNAINVGATPERVPWPLVFSFARALQQPALDVWRGQEANFTAAQHALQYRACCNCAALRGEYCDSMEEDLAFQKAS